MKRLLTKAGNGMLRRLLIPAARYPADPRAVFILSLCAFSGIPLVFADAAPGSIASQVSKPFVVVWGALLALGALLTLAGTVKQTVNGIIMEQIGSVAVGGATIFYGGAILIQVGSRGSVPAGIILGWGLSCFWRWFQLQALMSKAERAVQEAQGEPLEHDHAEALEEDRERGGEL
jgi:hypothetical protein